MGYCIIYYWYVIAQEDILEYESEPELDIPVAKRQVVDHSTCISDLDTSSNASDSEIMHTDYQISPASTPPSTPASSPDPLTLMTGANPLSPFATPTSGRSNRSTSTSHSRSVSPDPSLSLDLDEPCGDFDEPLYVESLVSKCEGWNLIMSFAIDNKLSYNAITNLLDLLYRLLPSPNKLPSSTYMLKKYYQEKKESFFKKLYCSECSEELTTEKFCSNHRCRQKRAEVCQYIGLPFEVTIRDIYEGMYIIHIVHTLPVYMHACSHKGVNCVECKLLHCEYSVFSFNMLPRGIVIPMIQFPCAYHVK